MAAPRAGQPQRGVDLLVALNQQTLDLHTKELTPGAVVVADQGLSCAAGSCLSVPYQELAAERHVNTIALGVAAGLLGLDQDLVADTLTGALGKKLDDKVVAAQPRGPGRQL